MRSQPRYTTTRISVADSRALLAKGRAVPHGLRRQIGEFAATPNLTAREAEMRDGLLVVRGGRSRVALLRRWFALRGVKVALPTLTRTERRAGYDLPHHRDAWGALRAEGHNYTWDGLLGGSDAQGVNLNLEEARLLMGAGRWCSAEEAVARANLVLEQSELTYPPLLRKMTLAYYEIVLPCRINSRFESSFDQGLLFTMAWRAEIVAWKAAGEPDTILKVANNPPTLVRKVSIYTDSDVVAEAVVSEGVVATFSAGAAGKPTVRPKSEVATFSAGGAIRGN